MTAVSTTNTKKKKRITSSSKTTTTTTDKDGNVVVVGGEEDVRQPVDRATEQRAREKLLKARIQLLMKNSFFGNLAVRLKMTTADDWCDTAATDGFNFFYNSRFIDSLQPGELIFLVGHEVLHVVYDHMVRRGSERDPSLWNVAADYAVNLDLVKHKIGEKITTVPCLFDRKYDGMSTEQIYDDLYENAEKIDLDQLLERLLDEHMESSEADKGLSQSERDQRRREIKQVIINAAGQSKAGEVPAGVAREIQRITNPTMNWRDLLNTNLLSTIRSDFSFSRVSRRSWHSDAILPGMVPGEMIKIAIALDMSGSISNKISGQFLGEVHGIMSAFENFEITLFCFDTKTYNQKIFSSENLDDLTEYQPYGGGGTSFSCIFDHLKDQGIEPDRLVIFTDGYTYDWGDENYCNTTFIIHGNSERNTEPPYGTWAYLENKS